MIAAMLKSALGWRGVVAVVAIAVAGGGWVLWRIEAGAHAKTTGQHETAQATIARLEIEAEQTRRSIERLNEQCAIDLAGALQRGEAEAEKARRAGEAIAGLTTACVQAQGPAATNRALRGVLGEVVP
jgi:hypothetical protein